MPLNDYNPPVQSPSSGTFTGTSGSASLSSATTPGNTVVLWIGWTNSPVTPSGFTRATPGPIAAPQAAIYYKSNVGAESSWTITAGSSAVVCWAAAEYEALDLVNPVDVVPNSVSTGTTASLSTGTTPISSTFDGMILGLHVCLDNTDGSSGGTWSGHTNGLVEIQTQAGSEATRSLGLSASMCVPALSVQTWSSTATKTAPVGEASSATIAVFTAAGAKRAADPKLICGFEWGTSAGLATGAVGANPTGPLDEMTAGVAVVSTDAHTGTYCVELDSSGGAAACNWRWLANGARSLMTPGQDVSLWAFKIVGSLPGVDVQLCALETSGTGTNVVWTFRTASGKFDMKIGTGTAVLSDAAISADTWYVVCARVDGRTTTYLGDWQICYDGATWVEQTQTTMAGATIATSGWHQRFGWTDSTAVKARFDTHVVSDIGGHYPLGPYDIRALTVDTGGTVTLSGTSTNWQTSDDNGSNFAAWNATTARTNLSEYPPAPGASAKLVAQIATATSDYVEVPLTTIAAASTMLGATRAARAMFMLWAASSTAATMGYRAHDGTTEITLTGTVDCQQDNSTTTPAWFCRMIRGAARLDWTQAKLDALALRFGFSNDANPKIGTHGMVVEVAFRIGDLVELISVEGQFFLSERLDPDTSGIISLIGEVPSGTRGATMTWTLNGTPDSYYVDPGVELTHEEFIGATDISQVTAYGLTADPA